MKPDHDQIVQHEGDGRRPLHRQGLAVGRFFQSQEEWRQCDGYVHPSTHSTVIVVVVGIDDLKLAAARAAAPVCTRLFYWQGSSD
jgi:hypothetical protein